MSTSGNIVITGSSTGGLRILERLFDNLPRLRCSIIVVHQMVSTMNPLLVDKLNGKTEMTVRLTENGMELQAGEVYVAAADTHLRLLNNGTIELFEGEKRNHHRPSVDTAMESLKAEAESKIVGIILTGVGRDGARGVRHVKRIGGMTIAQDQTTSPVANMPKAAFETGDVDLVLTPDEMRQLLIDMFETELKEAEAIPSGLTA
jgi:two-component system chemotaxis response regulator CheB